MDMMRSAIDVAGSTGLSPLVIRGGSRSTEGVAPAATQVGVIFDIADVLYDATSWRRWLWRLVTTLGVRASYGGFFRVWEREFLSDVHCGRREYTEAFQSFLLAVGLTWAQIDEVEAASRIQRQNWESKLRPLPGVVKTLNRLADAGVPLVAWCDAPYPATRMLERLERLGLAHPFQAVLSSFDLEAVQPSPAAYESVIEALGLPVSQIVYVGHDVDHLAGATAHGLRTVAFNFHPYAKADCYLTRFEDLLPHVVQGNKL